MGSETSEQVVALLAELATLKQLDQEYEANPSEGGGEAHRQRQQRQEEITREIQALAEEKKNSEAASDSARA
jgi:hypothetical protein